MLTRVIDRFFSPRLRGCEWKHEDHVLDTVSSLMQLRICAGGGSQSSLANNRRLGAELPVIPMRKLTVVKLVSKALRSVNTFPSKYRTIGAATSGGPIAWLRRLGLAERLHS